MAEAEGLVDLKLSKTERKAEAMTPAADMPAYSYGLVIRLEKAELEKLGINKLPQVEQKYTIEAVAIVQNVYESQSVGNRGDRAVSLQITKMKIT